MPPPLPLPAAGRCSAQAAGPSWRPKRAPRSFQHRCRPSQSPSSSALTGPAALRRGAAPARPAVRQAQSRSVPGRCNDAGKPAPRLSCTRPAGQGMLVAPAVLPTSPARLHCAGSRLARARSVQHAPQPHRKLPSPKHLPVAPNPLWVCSTDSLNDLELNITDHKAARWCHRRRRRRHRHLQPTVAASQLGRHGRCSLRPSGAA